MKKIEAAIKPFKLEAYEIRTGRIGKCKAGDHRRQGFRPVEEYAEIYCGSEEAADFLPKNKVEIVPADAQVSGLAAAIARLAKTNN